MQRSDEAAEPTINKEYPQEREGPGKWHMSMLCLGPFKLGAGTGLTEGFKHALAQGRL